MKQSSYGALQPVAPSLDRASTYAAASAEELELRFQALLGQHPLPDGANPFIYSRFGSPNSASLEAALLRYEHGAAAALVLPSGMSAIFTTLFACLKPGDVVLYTNPIYGCTEELLHNILSEWGITAVPVDTSSLPEVEAKLEDYGERVRVILLESPSNPVIKLTDIGSVVELALGIADQSEERPLVIVDNTFLGPFFQQPFAHGADIVVYSATKFLGGHSDILGGVVFTADEARMEPIRFCRSTTGPIMAADVCWLLERSLETLNLRMRHQADVAVGIASILSMHPAVERVFYPGLLNDVADPEQFRIYRKQCTGPGSMISCCLRGGKGAAFRFQNALRHFRIAVSLGGTHSLIEHPDSTSHAAVPPELKRLAGITPALVRLSVGAEPVDLLGDVRQALDTLV